jgi:hypothetical protein
MNPRLRTSILCACVSFTLPMANRLTAQRKQDDMETMKQRLLASGAAHELAARQFTTLPQGVLYLRFENFPTRESAHQAETPLGASLEWAGSVWLLTLGPKGKRTRGGVLVAEVGPVPLIPPAARYVMEVDQANLDPAFNAQMGRSAHIHPGPEIFYLLTGEQCLETPSGIQRARAGEGMTAPANTPMALNILGSSKRDAFFVVIHDATKPFATVSDWRPTGGCKE